MVFADLFHRRYSANAIPPPLDTQQVAAPKELRRVIGYHNAIVADSEENEDGPTSPPGYDISIFGRKTHRVAHKDDHGLDVLPRYTCSVSAEAPVELCFEQNTPFDKFKKQEWTQAYAVLSGSLLRLHTVRRPTPGILSLNTDRSQAGRLIRAFSMQHAEVGIAADEPKQQLLPKSPYISMLPEATIEKLKITEPHLFESVKRYFVRLRLEGEQLLFRLETSEDRSRWIDKLCAAVDIAPPIDDRTEPKYHTLPRRRRRRPPPSAGATAGPSDSSGQNPLPRDQSTRGALSPLAEGDVPLQQTATVDPDAGEIDNSLAFAGADMDSVPPPERSSRVSVELVRRIFSRRTASNFVEQDPHSPMSPISPTISNNVADTPTSPSQPEPVPVKVNTKVPARMYPDDFIKWQPQFYIDSAQQIRYRRHCMPSLLYNSRRANDVIVHQGKRWKIDWTQEKLLPWPEPAPLYTPPIAPPVVETQPEPLLQSFRASAEDTSSNTQSEGTGDRVDTAQTSITTTSQPADSARVSVHAGEGAAGYSSIEGWDWSHGRGKSPGVMPPTNQAAISTSLPEHQVSELTDTAGTVPENMISVDLVSEHTRAQEAGNVVPESPETPRRLRRSSAQVSRHVDEPLQAPVRSNGNAAESRQSTKPAQAASPVVTPARSGRRSFQLFARPSPAQLNSTRDEAANQAEPQVSSTKGIRRLSAQLKRPFSGRPSLDVARPDLDSIAPATPFTPRRESRTSTQVQRPNTSRPSIETSRPEILIKTPTTTRSSRLSMQLKRPSSGRPSMEASRPDTAPTPTAVEFATPTSRKSGRSSFQAMRPSFDLFRNKNDELQSSPVAHATPASTTRSKRLSFQIGRPKMADLVSDGPGNSVPLITSPKVGGWKRWFGTGKKNYVEPQVLREKTPEMEMCAPAQAYSVMTSAWQSGHVSVVVEE